MQVKITGLLIDKFEHISRDKKTGQENKSLKCIVYQQESHQAVTITVNSSTFAKLESLKPCILDCVINSFAGQNGQVVTYLKELAA